MNDYEILAIIQARMGSSRLPNKTMVDICGKPLLSHVIERMKFSSTIDEIAVATTTSPDDKVILELAKELGVKSYAGNQTDVLDRFFQVANSLRPKVIIRITADDPFKDPEVVDRVTNHLISNIDELDYVSNTIVPTFPEGLDVEVFTFEALKRAWMEAKLPSEREHVTPYIWKHREKFRLYNIRNYPDLSYLRWTLDYNEDLIFTRKVYDRLYFPGRIFLMKDILQLLEKYPEIAKINHGIERNLGYSTSLKGDQQTAI